MKNNKGFSLVELIIVIAIMAILVGVMAPQLIKYIEKTNVSSDTQLCDSVKTAITTAMMDPSVISATNNGIPSNTAMASISTISTGTAFGDAFYEILGAQNAAGVTAGLKSTGASGKVNDIQFAIVGANSVHVTIPGSDASGKKGKGNNTVAIYVD